MKLFGRKRKRSNDTGCEVGVTEAKALIDNAMDAQRALLAVQEMLVTKVFDFEGADAELKPIVERMQCTIRACLGDVRLVADGAAKEPSDGGKANDGGEEGMTMWGTEGSREISSMEPSDERTENEGICAESTERIPTSELKHLLADEIPDISCNVGEVDAADRELVEGSEIGDLLDALGAGSDDEMFGENIEPASAGEDGEVKKNRRTDENNSSDDVIDLDDLVK
ncbi:MAG: hypothetical protein GF344_12595 [Chitinivibrionales bacterium]|nr:hypothetical protein [Chitinivibrionales bacterium]MBD3357590.1 hypothetical protein [Chitinivibrionales bacterium]